ncbi:copper chaperone PCu(A)C [Pseudidiomarina sp. CB1]|uniref:copper chaperone PCu(A)C n=1 Tax=Pseudidiomarina sp. CB1 TaxID=2972484 RepID=UPI002162ED13|nr:copper chaperone PCu(A)C [Pseudidiomarina sp. CB1]
MKRLQLLALAACFVLPLSAWADVTVSDAWVKPTIPGTENGAGYFVIRNDGAQAVTLIGVNSDASRASEVHQHVMNEEGMMRMRRVPELTINAGEQVVFQPGSYHIMFFGVKNPFRVGESVAFQLQFTDADALDVVAEVRSLK